MEKNKYLTTQQKVYPSKNPATGSAYDKVNVIQLTCVANSENNHEQIMFSK